MHSTRCMKLPDDFLHVTEQQTRLQEKLAAVIKAEGESEAAKLISDATKAYGGGMIELRRVEAAKEVAQTLSKGRNVTYLPGSDSNILMNLQT